MFHGSKRVCISQSQSTDNLLFSGIPRQATAYKALLAGEPHGWSSMSKTVIDPIGTAHFVNTGLHLERDQLVTD